MSRHFILFLACVNGCARGVQSLSTRDMHVASSAADPEVEPTLCVNPYDEKSAWRALPQDPADVRFNICAEGKQLPEFYLLGPPKCSTTSLSLDLMATGIGTMGWDYRNENTSRRAPRCSKEWHFFDRHMTSQQLSGKEARQEWIAEMPTCPTDRRVLADFTPDSLRLVPKIGSNNLPQILQDWYGSQASAVTFAVMLRSPLGRLHSVWHHAGWSGRSSASSFQAAIEERMDLVNASSDYREVFGGEMYSLHLKSWLEHFNASQFVLIPFKQYVAGDKDLVCKAISKKLRYQMMCDSEGRPAAEAKHPDGPSLDDDTTERFQTRFDRFMETETGHLVHMMASMHSEGAALPGYDGLEGDKAATRAWLLDNW